MTLEASGKIAAGAKIQYICTIVHGEALHQLGKLSADVASSTSDNLKSNLLDLGT